MKRFVVSGIGTEVGKTVASAILAEALEAAYWKPVQAGDLDNTDTMKVQSWTSKVNCLTERYKLKTPASPHYAAAVDGITISPSDFQIPESDRNLVIEGAGGLMVPLNNEGLLYIDLFEKWQVPVILVSRHYLGSINHTLLSVDALKRRGIPIAGILFNGDENRATEEIIQSVTQVPILGRIENTNEINLQFIQHQALAFHYLKNED
jgi:dethiobiotin synthetase